MTFCFRNYANIHNFGNVTKFLEESGGKSQLGDKLNVLQQRTIIAFPDVDGYELWKQKASELSSLRITVSDYLETSATPEERDAHIDIADRLIAQIRDGLSVPAVPLGGTRDNGTQNRVKVMNTQIQQIIKMFLNYPQLLQNWFATEFVFLSDDSVGFRVTTPIYNGTIVITFQDKSFYCVSFRDLEFKILGIVGAEDVLDAVKDFVENGEVWV